MTEQKLKIHAFSTGVKEKPDTTDVSFFIGDDLRAGYRVISFTTNTVQHPEIKGMHQVIITVLLQRG